jgi:hypothetical protein
MFLSYYVWLYHPTYKRYFSGSFLSNLTICSLQFCILAHKMVLYSCAISHAWSNIWHLNIVFCGYAPLLLSLILHGNSGIDEARFSNYFYLCMVFMRILLNKNLIASFSGAWWEAVSLLPTFRHSLNKLVLLLEKLEY